MSVYRPKYTVKGQKKVSRIWWYKFTFAGQPIRESFHYPRVSAGHE